MNQDADNIDALQTELSLKLLQITDEVAIFYTKLFKLSSLN